MGEAENNLFTLRIIVTLTITVDRRLSVWVSSGSQHKEIAQLLTPSTSVAYEFKHVRGTLITFRRAFKKKIQ